MKVLGLLAQLAVLSTETTIQKHMTLGKTKWLKLPACLSKWSTGKMDGTEHFWPSSQHLPVWEVSWTLPLGGYGRDAMGNKNWNLNKEKNLWIKIMAKRNGTALHWRNEYTFLKYIWLNVVTTSTLLYKYHSWGFIIIICLCSTVDNYSQMDPTVFTMYLLCGLEDEMAI